jgi:hypothetical protein
MAGLDEGRGEPRILSEASPRRRAWFRFHIGGCAGFSYSLVGRVEAAEAGPGGDGPGPAVAAGVADVGDHLILHVAGVQRLSAGGLGHRQRPVHPGQPVDGVDGEEAQAAGHEERLDGLHQPEALVLEEVGGGGGKEQHRRAGVAIGDDGHLEAQRRAAPAIDALGQAGIDVLWGHAGKVAVGVAAGQCGRGGIVAVW